MMHINNAIRSAFDRKRTATLVFFGCIAAKTILLFYYSYVGKDKIYSLSAAYNLWHGKGWTNTLYEATHLQQELTTPFCFWPPGYGILISPFIQLFGDNLFLATTIFELISFIAFLWLCRAILKTQRRSRPWLTIAVVLITFFPHEFIEASLGTDLPALCFVLGFYYSAIRIWQSSNRIAIVRHGLMAGTCLFLAGFTRYMYVPIGALTAVLLPLIGYWLRNRSASSGYWVALLLFTIASIAANVYQSNACGSPFYTGVDEKGVFIQNLSYWYPSVLAAFLNINLLAVQLGKLSHYSYLAWQQVFSWINLVLYLPIMVIGSIVIIHPLKRRRKEDFPLFFFLGFLLSAAIIGGLALLSVSHGRKSTSGGWWTFIEEGRYQAFPVVFIQLWFITQLPALRTGLRNRSLKNIGLSLLFLTYSLAWLHQVYYTAKVAVNYPSMKRTVAREQDYVFFDGYLKTLLHQQPATEIVVASTDRYYTLLTSMLGGKGLLQWNEQMTIQLDTPSIFILVKMPRETLTEEWIQSNNAVLVQDIAGVKFYRVDRKTSFHP